MDTSLALVACCLLTLVPLAQAGTDPPTAPFPTTASTSNGSHASTAFTTPNSTVNTNTALDTTGNTTHHANTTSAQATGGTELSTASTSSSQIPRSSTASSAAPTAKTSTQSLTASVLTTHTSRSTASDTSAPATPQSPHPGATTSASGSKTQGLGLNLSEQRLTIILSAILGTFIVTAMSVLIFRKCKHKIQYLHQPLSDAEPDGDTLVISGGLYDGHPIYDNVPPPPSEDQSQYRLEFLH